MDDGGGGRGGRMMEGGVDEGDRGEVEGREREKVAVG